MPPIRWFDNTSVQEAVDTAAQHGTPMLVDFWSPTCSGCAKLFATTYRDPDVQAYLARTFVCIKYNTKAPNPWFKRLNGSYGHHWHPNVVVMDHRLTEARRFIGYLSADEFVAQLEVGRALMALRHGQAVESLAVLQGVLARSPGTFVAPEAMYWAGVAAYRAGGGLAALTPIWADLAVRYPASEWVLRADCLDVRIAAGGFSPDDPHSVQVITAAQPTP